MDLDGVLAELGAFGRYQLRTYFLILLPIMLSAVYNSQYVFAAGEIEYRCAVPECEYSPPTFATGNWGVWALPEQPTARCRRNKPVAASCDPSSFLRNQTVSCREWIYESKETIVAEFDLACQDWKRALVGTIHSAGLLTALSIIGVVSDTFGRRLAFIMTASIRSIFGVARGCCTDYITYVVLEFFDAATGSGVYTTGFILALELVAQNRRVLGGNLMASGFAIGQALLAVSAWLMPDWRSRTLVTYAPSILFIFYFFCLEESVRWLISKNRKDEAAQIIFKAAQVNGKELSPAAIRHLKTESVGVSVVEDLIQKIPQSKERSLACQVLHSRVMLSRIFVCSFWWMSVTFVYYGLSINSVSLAGNKYTNYILVSLVEIPGYIISMLTLDRFGRKSSIITALFLCGAALVILPFLPSDRAGATLALSLFGKLSVSMAFSSIYVYSMELFPTGIRNRILAGCSMVGRLGQLAAPLSPLLLEYMKSLPYLLFGAMAVCSGLLMLLTPETLRMKLPDTVAQAENMAAPHRRHTHTEVIDD